MDLAMILLAMALKPADAVPGDVAPDATLIQGRWEYISVSCDGQPFPLEKGDHIVISGRNMTIHRNGMVIKSKYTLEPGKSPKQMDLVVERDGTTFRLKEIYRLEDDKLTLCEPASPEAPRPTTFSAEKGEKQFLIILRRNITKEKKPVRPATPPR